MTKKPRGKCPSCGVELKKVGQLRPEGGRPKGRYKCMNIECDEKRWFNRFGEPR
jgi:hypothetical protein